MERRGIGYDDGRWMTVARDSVLGASGVESLCPATALLCQYST